MPVCADWASLMTHKWAIKTNVGISTQLAHILLHTSRRQEAGSWEVMAKCHGQTRTNGCVSNETGVGRARVTRLETPGGLGLGMGELPVVCVTAFETSSAADSMSAGTPSVLQSRGRRCLRGVNTQTLGTADAQFVSREGASRRTELRPSYRLRRGKFAGSEGRSCNPGGNIATGTA